MLECGMHRKKSNAVSLIAESRDMLQSRAVYLRLLADERNPGESVYLREAARVIARLEPRLEELAEKAEREILVSLV